MSQIKGRGRRIYTLADVHKHNTRQSCWVVRNNVVYDVTKFADDHPGGDDLVFAWAGKDVGAIMEDPREHSHSESAYDILNEYVVGRIHEGEMTVDDAVEIDNDFEPEETDAARDFEKNEFLDLSKPLIPQVWQANWSKDYYLLQVHQPRHLPEPATLFGQWYLEMFTRTKWWVVPAVWGPITLGFAYKSIVGHIAWGFSTPVTIGLWFAAYTFGCFFWTFIEYFMHRFLFHIDEMLPDHQIALLLHFLLHGIHHYLPMDRLRLVMPPILFAALSGPFLKLAHALFPAPTANAVIAGSYTLYMCYDCMHYAMHHSRMPEYMRQMKVYHLQHHWKNFDLGFGVTSKIWDHIFGTALPSAKI